MAIITPTRPTFDLVAPHTNRLRCPGCHRFLGTVGATEVECERCVVFYRRTPFGDYVKEAA